MELWAKKYDNRLNEENISNLNEMISNLFSIVIDNIEDDEKPKKESDKNDKVVIKDIRQSKEDVVYNKRDERNFKPLYLPKLKRVLFTPPATVAWFVDGSKTTAVAGHGDTYDKETGLAVCMLKRVLGNKEYRRIMDEYCYDKKELLN